MISRILLIMYISQLVKNFKLLLLLIVFTISNATSEEIKTEKIHFAVINIQKITESCSVFQDIRNQMNDQFKKLSLKFDKQAKSIIDNENNLEKQKSVLDQKSYSEKMSEITKSKQKIQTELDSDKQKLQKIKNLNIIFNCFFCLVKSVNILVDFNFKMRFTIKIIATI